MERLPLELWFYISEFFTDDDLYTLLGVNRFFFDLAMDRKYSEVSVGMENRKLRGWLNHVGQPNVAGRIKSLSLRIHPIHTESRPTPAVGNSLTRSIQRAMQRVLPGLEGRNPEPEVLDIKGMVEKLIITIPLMTAVKELSIINSSTYDLDDVYRLAWSVFGPSLRQLSICTDLTTYGSIIDTGPFLPSLETLDLEFMDNMFGHLSPRREILDTQLIPFVNSFRRELKTFKVHSISRIDLSDLFGQIQTFENLETVWIRAPFNYALRKDPSSLRDFLREASTTLRNVLIRLTPLGLAVSPDTSVDAPSCEWLTDCVSDPLCFRKVEAMDICPTPLPAGMNILSKCISNSHHQLQSFTVRDRYLKLDEALELSKLLRVCARLTYLRFNILHLNVETFDALARDLPHVRYLRLSVGDSSDSATSETTFRNDLKSRRYSDWKLWDLIIWRSGYELDEETMLAVIRSIPSLSSKRRIFEEFL